jgi:HAD superfamily hydrolase (TIGR01509 family)
MPPIQVVLFDLGGTLLHYDQPPEFSMDALNAAALRAFLASAIKAGGKVPDPELAVRAVGRMGAALEAKATRTHYANTAENIIQEGLQAVKVRLPDAAWDAGLAAYYSAVSAVVKPVEGDPQAVLSKLTEQGRGLGLVSNTFWAPAMHDADLMRFGMLDHLPVRVYSSAFGMVKPHPTIYRQALDRLDVAPAEAVFVGDKLAVDIAGPQKIGMRAVLIASPFRVEENPEIIPDARIQTIDELPGVLETWDRVLEMPVP